MPNNDSDNKMQSKSQGSSENEKNSQPNAQADNKQNSDNSQIKQQPRSEQLLTKLDKLIDNFEESLKSKSNKELSTISNQLSIVERAMLLDKIDNQLNSMKESVIRTGDISSSTSVGASSASDSEAQQPENAGLNKS